MAGVEHPLWGVPSTHGRGLLSFMSWEEMREGVRVSDMSWDELRDAVITTNNPGLSAVSH